MSRRMMGPWEFLRMYCTVQSRGPSDTTGRESIHRSTVSGLLYNTDDHRKQSDKLQ